MMTFTTLIRPLDQATIRLKSQINRKPVKSSAWGSRASGPTVKGKSKSGFARLSGIGGLNRLEQTLINQEWYGWVNWPNVGVLIGLPMAGLVAAIWAPLYWTTLIWSVIYYFATGLGITAGYHRLWAHKSYSAKYSLRVALALLGAGSVEGSIRWWAQDHRAHHRYTDTDKDPYSVRKGLLYAHMGWLVMKQHPGRAGRTDISDLNADLVVLWQHRNYNMLVAVMGFAVPAFVAGLFWDDLQGGLVYAGILRMSFVQQATFCTNSLAHWFGDQPFNDSRSARDHTFTALLTLGEGYHNFHHEFPSDFRNTIHWYQYDPTKWAIKLWETMGLASDLKQFPHNEIEMGRIQQSRKRLEAQSAQIDWGTPLNELPVITWDEYLEKSGAGGKQLVVVAGVVHDISGFMSQHPGGRHILASSIGKDATAVFNGAIYGHSNAARNLLTSMRVGVIHQGSEVETSRRPSIQKTVRRIPSTISMQSDISTSRLRMRSWLKKSPTKEQPSVPQYIML